MDMNFYNNNTMGYNNMMGGMPAPYPGMPMQYTQIRMPQNTQNALTPEEIQSLQKVAPKAWDINIDEDSVKRATCTHKAPGTGQDVVQYLSDGSGMVYCPLCNTIWDPTALSEEEVSAATTTTVTALRNALWTGDYPSTFVRDIAGMIPLMEKIPAIYEQAIKTNNKYLNQMGYNNANEASTLAQYTAMMHTGYDYGYNPAMQNPYMYNQPYQAQPQMSYGQVAPMQQNPYVNPMQAPYGVAQQPMNTQFTDQANAMMNGTVYNQAPAAPMQQAYAPVNYAPAAAQQAAPQVGVNQQVSSAPVTEGNTTMTETTVAL